MRCRSGRIKDACRLGGEEATVVVVVVVAVVSIM